ncbi:MAG: sulfotransferase domain-containing protein [Caldilineaceae bacterium]
MTAPYPQLFHTYQNHILDNTRWHYYQPREGDIVISTPLKSGTTWMIEIVSSLVRLNQASAEPVGAQEGNVSVWFEPRWAPLDESIAKLEAQQHRRVIKSHLPLDGLPFYPQVQYIVVGRDTRDVFMSLWNQHANYVPDFLAFLNGLPDRVGDPMPAAPDNIHEFWHDWITRGWFPWESEGYPYWGNLHHTRTWWEYHHLPNICFVHYNDLLADLAGEIQHVADFLKISLAEEQRQAIAKAVTFDAMRERALKDDHGKPSVFTEGAKTFFFKGTNDRWKDVLSAEELALYEEKAAQVLTPDCQAWLEQGRKAFK